MFPHGDIEQSRTPFQIAAPGRPDPSAGSTARIWVCLRFAASAQILTRAAGDTPDSRIGNSQRLINPGEFDKAESVASGQLAANAMAQSRNLYS
jgi:hypothetical protein